MLKLFAKNRLFIIISTVLVFAMAGCGGGGGTAGSSDTGGGSIGGGGGGVGGTVSATLNWNPPDLNTDGSTLSDLAGYKVYYRDSSSGTYGDPVDVGNATSGVIDGLSAGTTYYFSVTAYDSSGNESDYAPEVSKTM